MKEARPAGLLLPALTILLLCSAASAQSISAVRINEVFANNRSFPAPHGRSSDWVELVNTSNTPVDLSGARLTDDPADLRKWVVPPGVILPANGHLVVLMDNEIPPTTTAGGLQNTGFGLSGSGDRVHLYAAGTDGLVDAVEFGLQIVDWTLGRFPDGSGPWKLCRPTYGGANQEASLGPVSDLRVNEWMASPDDGEDWFELCNTGTLPVALGGLWLTDNLTNPSKHAIAPLSFLGTGLQGYQVFWADSLAQPGADHVNFALSANGESIAIFNASTRLDLVTFGPQAGGVSQGRFPDGAAAIVDFRNSSSPGEPNYRLVNGLHVNEVLSHADPPLEDAIEFHNSTALDIAIGGWYLSDSKSQPAKYRIPAGTVVPAHGYKVFYDHEFDGPTAEAPFGLDSVYGESVFLFQTDTAGNLTGYRVEQHLGPTSNGISVGRVPTSQTGVFDFVRLERRTFGVDAPLTLDQFRTGTGLPNAGPLISPVVLSEIHYQPPSAGGADNTADEYVELFNRAFATTPLYDPDYPENTWRIGNGIAFTFPAGVRLPPRTHAVVVSFNPATNPSQTTAFRQKFGVPPAVPVFGPFSGRLSNSGETIELLCPEPPQQPPAPDAGHVPLVVVEAVSYRDAAPWPAAANGAGSSLQRSDPSAHANDPINWLGLAPTPGRAAIQGPDADRDGDGLPDRWETANDLDPLNAADANADPDSDGLTNLQEYLAGTDPRDNASRPTLEAAPAESLPGSILLRFRAVENRAYAIQIRSSLSPAAPWSNYRFFNPESTSRTVELLEPQIPGQHGVYFRLVVGATS